jgi:hypothetical protein
MTNLTQTPEQRPFRGDKSRTFGMVIAAVVAVFLAIIVLMALTQRRSPAGGEPGRIDEGAQPQYPADPVP